MILSVSVLHCLHSSFQDDEGDNAFHIAADAAKMIRENLEWLIVMLRNPDAAVEVRNHRQVVLLNFFMCLVYSVEILEIISNDIKFHNKNLKLAALFHCLLKNKLSLPSVFQMCSNKKAENLNI